ncbi:MAG: AIR synthase-related protein, partial [Paracoccaceae bacterium]
RNGEFLRANRKLVSAATDLSDGGLALAAFEMAEAAGLGVALDSADIGQLFGEDQARYLVAVAPRNAAALEDAATKAGVPLARAGSFGGAQISFGSQSAGLAELSTLYRTAFAAAVA